jgi:hypothetical protein
MIPSVSSKFNPHEISNKKKNSFDLQNKPSTEFYGFNHNYPLSFESFSSCFIDKSDHIESAINSYSFTNKASRE